MHALVKECCITFNDLVAARFDTQHLDFWAAFTTPASKAGGYAKMIGASLPSLGTELPSQHLNLPLPFFYARDSGVALPTAALPYNEMRINFVFRDWREMIVAVYNSQAGIDNTNSFCIPYDTSSYPPNDKPQNNICNKLLNCCDIGNAVSTVGQDSFCNQLAGLAGKVPLSEVTFLKEPSLANGSSVQVWANYAIVSNEERKRMACAPRDILIEQVQTMPSVNIHQRYCFDVSQSGTNVSSSNQTNSKLINADVRFSHAVKVLFFAAKNITNNAIHSNYTTGIPVLSSSNEKLCVANCGLATRYNAPTPSSITYQSATQYACELSDSQQSSKNTQYGIMTQQCCLKLDCCNAKDPLV
jgi:hypothetical protein